MSRGVNGLSNAPCTSIKPMRDGPDRQKAMPQNAGNPMPKGRGEEHSQDGAVGASSSGKGVGQEPLAAKPPHKWKCGAVPNSNKSAGSK